MPIESLLELELAEVESIWPHSHHLLTLVHRYESIGDHLLVQVNLLMVENLVLKPVHDGLVQVRSWPWSDSRAGAEGSIAPRARAEGSIAQEEETIT